MLFTVFTTTNTNIICIHEWLGNSIEPFKSMLEYCYISASRGLPLAPPVAEYGRPRHSHWNYICHIKNIYICCFWCHESTVCTVLLNYIIFFIFRWNYGQKYHPLKRKVSMRVLNIDKVISIAMIIPYTIRIVATESANECVRTVDAPSIIVLVVIFVWKKG